MPLGINDPITPVSDQELETEFKNLDPNAIYEDPTLSQQDPAKAAEPENQDDSGEPAIVPPADGATAETKTDAPASDSGEPGTEDKPVSTPAPADSNIDYKQRFIDKDKKERELYQQNQDIINTLSQEVTAPTDEELTKAAQDKGLDFTKMDEFQKVMFKDLIFTQKKAGLIDQVREVNQIRTKWGKEIDEYTGQTEVETKLKGRTNEFKQYAMKPENVNIPLDKLSTLFVYDELPKMAPKKQSLPFNVNTGGKAPEKPAAKGLEASAKDRKINQKEWQEKVASGEYKAAYDEL